MIDRMVQEGFDQQRFVSSVAQTFLRRTEEKERRPPPLSTTASARHDYRSVRSFEERRRESLKLRAEHPDRLPVIVEKKNDGRDVPELDRHKFLVPADLSVGQFVYLIRRRVRLPPERAIFLFARHTLPPVGSSVAQVYEEHRDSDGFLYLNYSGERTFG